MKRINKEVFTPMLNKFLSGRPEKERKPGFHPSELADDKCCPRDLVLKVMGFYTRTKRDFTPAQIRRIFDNGDYMHERYHDYVKQMGIVLPNPKNEKNQLWQECLISVDDLLLHGSPDDIIVTEDKDYYYVIDYKSCNLEAFEVIKKEDDAGERYKRQLNIYLGILTSCYDFDRPLRGIIFYECKDNQGTKEFVYDYDDEALEYFVTICTALRFMANAVKNNDPEAVECTCGKCQIPFDLEMKRMSLGKPNKPIEILTEEEADEIARELLS